MPNDENIVDFEALELEDEETTEEPDKLATMLSFLEKKLKPEDYKELTKEMGLEEDDLSNKELLEKLMDLIQAAKPKDEEEEEEEEDEKEMADQQTFMEECLKEGKSREECLEEWKKKYPEPEDKEKKEGEQELKKDEKELKDTVARLEKELADMQTKLENQKEMAKIEAEVDQLVRDKHLAPVQKNMAIKLAANATTPEQREEFFNFFRTTQRFNVDNDVGNIRSSKPGKLEISEEQRNRILKEQGLEDLIQDKGDKSKLPWRNS